MSLCATWAFGKGWISDFYFLRNIWAATKDNESEKLSSASALIVWRTGIKKLIFLQEKEEWEDTHRRGEKKGKRWDTRRDKDKK